MIHLHLRLAALLLDILGTILLIVGVLRFKHVLIEEEKIDDKVVRVIVKEKTLIYVALVCLCVSFSLHFINEMLLNTRKMRGFV